MAWECEQVRGNRQIMTICCSVMRIPCFFNQIPTFACMSWSCQTAEESSLIKPFAACLHWWWVCAGKYGYCNFQMESPSARNPLQSIAMNTSRIHSGFLEECQVYWQWMIIAWSSSDCGHVNSQSCTKYKSGHIIIGPWNLFSYNRNPYSGLLVTTWKWFGMLGTFAWDLLPHASAVEVIESVPSVCVCLSVCLLFSTLMAEPFDVGTWK